MSGALPAPSTSCVWKLLIGNHGSHGIYLLFHQQTATDRSHNPPPAVPFSSRPAAFWPVSSRLSWLLCRSVLHQPSPAVLRISTAYQRPFKRYILQMYWPWDTQGFCSWGNIIDLRYIQALPDVAPTSCSGGDGCTNGNCVVLTDITSFVKQAWQTSLGTFVSYNKHSADWEIFTSLFFFSFLRGPNGGVLFTLDLSMSFHTFRSD